MGNTVANVVTAVAAMVTAIGVVLTAFTVFVPMLKQVKDVHTIVNQQRTDDLQYRKALIKALKEAGIDVPENQSELE